MSRPTPNHSENTQGYIAELPAERLALPEPYLYKLLLDEQKVEDTAERRRQFKHLLVSRQIEEGIVPPQVDQKELADFMNPDDFELKMGRSISLARILERHLEEAQNFAQAQRLAVLELFHREAPLRQTEMDEAYFQNAELVRADLEHLATAISEKTGKTIQPEDLNTNHMEAPFTFTNGESVTGRAYINRAAIALGKARNAKEVASKRAYTIRTLKETAGFDILDQEYFQNSDKVKADLTAFAVQLGEGKTLLDLSTGNMRSLSITCQNGQVMNGGIYLSRAAIALGKAKNAKDASSKKACTLRTLKETAGFDFFYREYFQNSDKVKADLTAFAVHLSEGKTLLDLSTGNISSLSITCQNGQVMKWETYLSRAAIALGKAKNAKEAAAKKVYTIRTLKETAGFDLPEYSPTDEAYFKDSAKVRTDLISLAVASSKKAGRTIQPKDLNTNHIATSFTLTTGESMIGSTYLRRAAKALGKAKSKKEAQKIQKKILILLKQTAGLTPE